MWLSSGDQCLNPGQGRVEGAHTTYNDGGNAVVWSDG